MEENKERNFDENLAEAVRRYPSLYDKASPVFKDKHKKKNAWENIAKELDLAESI